MDTHLLRAQHLYNLQRYAEAEAELGKALAANPKQAEALLYLALTLSSMGEDKRALEAAQTGLAQWPDASFAHYVMAIVLYNAEDFVSAQASVDEAIKIDPDEADYWAISAQLAFRADKSITSLELAERALELDPKHTQAGNIRVAVLQKLKRLDEAEEAIDLILHDNPENSDSHTYRGWSELHNAEPDKAAAHFREALRLDASNDTARSGLVESLKARHFVYRSLMQFFLWMASLTPGTRWLIVIGGYLAYRFAFGTLMNIPGGEPLAWGLLAVYGGFVYLTWTGSAVFNFFLLFNSDGRLAMDKDDNNSALLFAGAFGIAVILAISALATANTQFLAPAMGFLALGIPISKYFNVFLKRSRRVVLAFIAGIGVGLLWMISLLASGDDAFGPLAYVALATFVFSFVANALE